MILLAHSYKLNSVCNAEPVPHTGVSDGISLKGFAQKSITIEVQHKIWNTSTDFIYIWYYPDMDPQEIVFHSLRHTSATTKLLMSGGVYNSVMQAGGWSNLEMLTRRYGKHSFASEREKLAGKMDEFLDGKGISEPQKNEKDEAGSAEQVLQQLMKSNPELLIEFARSVQNANKK